MTITLYSIAPSVPVEGNPYEGNHMFDLAWLRGAIIKIASEPKLSLKYSTWVKPVQKGTARLGYLRTWWHNPTQSAHDAGRAQELSQELWDSSLALWVGQY